MLLKPSLPPFAHERSRGTFRRLPGYWGGALIVPARIIARTRQKTRAMAASTTLARRRGPNRFGHLLASISYEAPLPGFTLVMSGGTEGALSPHWIVFQVMEDSPRTPTASRALAMASLVTRDLAPEELGRSAQVEVVAQGVREAMRRAGISRAEDVHFRTGQVPAPDDPANRRSTCARADLRHRGYAEIHGLFPRRIGPRHGSGSGRT